MPTLWAIPAASATQSGGIVARTSCIVVSSPGYYDAEAGEFCGAGLIEEGGRAAGAATSMHLRQMRNSALRLLSLLTGVLLAHFCHRFRGAVATMGQQGSEEH